MAGIIGSLTDLELLALLADGREDAFSVLFDRYYDTVRPFILRYVHSAPLADDLAQEVFIRLWENRKKLPQLQSFKAYLMVSARNHTLNSLRAIFRSEAAMGELLRGYEQGRSQTADIVLQKDYQAFLENILSSLPERTRTIFRQCREQGRSYEEVAADLGISKSAVKNHMVYAMKVMRASVEKELGISLSVLLAVLLKH
jgi:RNA polymerase sigma-70 factor (family 1)